MKLTDKTNVFVVVGPPGCGKTYSIAKNIEKNIGEYGETGIMVCSLTKTAAREASGRVGLPHEQVGTLHSFAYRAIGGGAVAESKIDEWNEAFPSLSVSGGTVSDDVDDNAMDQRGGNNTDGDELMSKLTLLRARCVRQDSWPVDVRMFFKKWSDWKQSCGYIDFSDMIEIATTDTVTAPGNPYLIYMDEAQDCSLAESRLLSHWGGAAHKVVVVGDPMQSLYEWRGADPDEFFPADIPAERKHILAQSYRVPEAVRAEAVRWANRMRGRVPEEYHARKYFDGETAFGSVRYSDASLTRNLDDIVRMVDDAKGTVMILASCAYQLKPIITELRAAGIPFHNPYRMRNGAWNPMGGKRGGVSARARILAFNQINVAGAWTMLDIQKWADVLATDGVLKRGAKAEIKAADTNRAYTWIELSSMLENWFEPESFEPTLNADVKWWYDHLTKAKKPGAAFPVEIFLRRGADALAEQPKVIVGTIHSVKGGEADTVILSPDLSKSGYLEWDAESAGIRRLFYVGMTRAIENLILLSPASRMAVDWGE